MANGGIERLREHLRAHNRRVALLAVVTLLAAVALWLGLYTVTWWLYLLGGSSVHPADWQPSPQPIMRGFAATAVLLCVMAWLGRRMRPNVMARDEKRAGEVAMDVILAVPRVTLSIWGTLRAATRLSDHELTRAWDLLRRMSKADGPLPVQLIPQEIPGEKTRHRVLMALQLSQLVEVRRGKDGPVLAFYNEKARKLAEERVRLKG